MRNNKPAIVTGIVLVVLLLLVMWGIGNKNALVGSRNQVDNSWAKVETQYQRRFDLIGSLVNVTKGSQIQEQEVFGKIADARKQYQQASNPNDKAAAASQLETNVAVIPKLQEAYPDLKSNANVQTLLKELSGTEGQVATVRDKYNDTATNYNTNIERFPKSIFASMFGFQKRNLFKANPAAAQPPSTNFNDLRQ